MLRAAMDREARVSLDAYRCLYSASAATEIGGVTVLRAEAAPLSPMLNRIVGLGVDEPASEAVLDAALAAIGDDVACYVALAPQAQPTELADWLRIRGLEPGWGWMSFRRNVEPVARRPTSLELVRVGSAEAQDFGRIVATGYGLPDAVVPWTAQAPSLGWECWLAVDSDEPAAAAGVSSPRASGTSVSRRRCWSIEAREPRTRCSPRGSITRGRRDATSSSPRPASVAATFLPTRIATSSAPASGRWPCAPTGSGRRPPRARRIRSRASAAAGNGRPSARGG